MKFSLNRYVVFNLIWITICVITILVGDTFPIEWASPVMRSITFIGLCLTLPISIIWTGNEIFGFRSKAFGVSVSLISLPIIGIALLGRTMCGTTEKILYTNRNNSTTIVARSFGCGAWDSDLPKYTFYRKTSFLSTFFLKTKVDTAMLNKSFWERH